MIEVNEAVDLLKSYVKPQINIEKVEILDALGFANAKDIYAPFSVPPYPKSAMDGYAVKSTDTLEIPVKLKVIGHILAGDDKNYIGKTKTAVRIMTGGSVPDGYDAIIKQEDTDYGTFEVEIYKKMERYENYCKTGEDIKKDELIIKKFTKLNFAHISILASLGIDKIEILSPMKVGIIATGSELLKPGEMLQPAKIYDSCSYMIASLLKSHGIKVLFIDICNDETDVMCKKINDYTKDVDVLITTGAVSVGEKDIIPEVLEKIGAEKIFKHVRMKPGTPVLASYYNEKIILSLSGHPFAALTNFQAFFWHIFEIFMQNPEFGLRKSKAIVKEGKLKKSKMCRYIRAKEENGFITLPANKHFASVISNITECNCLIEQKPDLEINSGDTVDILYF